MASTEPSLALVASACAHAFDEAHGASWFVPVSEQRRLRLGDRVGKLELTSVLKATDSPWPIADVEEALAVARARGLALAEFAKERGINAFVHPAGMYPSQPEVHVAWSVARGVAVLVALVHGTFGSTLCFRMVGGKL